MQKLKRLVSDSSNVIARKRGVFFVLVLALTWGAVCFGADNPPGKENASGGSAIAMPGSGAEAGLSPVSTPMSYPFEASFCTFTLEALIWLG